MSKLFRNKDASGYSRQNDITPDRFSKGDHYDVHFTVQDNEQSSYMTVIKATDTEAILHPLTPEKSLRAVRIDNQNKSILADNERRDTSKISINGLVKHEQDVDAHMVMSEDLSFQESGCTYVCSSVTNDWFAVKKRGIFIITLVNNDTFKFRVKQKDKDYAFVSKIVDNHDSVNIAIDHVPRDSWFARTHNLGDMEILMINSDIGIKDITHTTKP